MAQIRDLILKASAMLEATSSTARLDAEILLGYVLEISRVKIIADAAREVDPEKEAQFYHLVERRARCEPVAYILGEKEFFGLAFDVAPGVLIPRPDTETLVEAALEECERFWGPVSILDLGTGSGCIAIAIAAALQRDERAFKIVAVERSAAALQIAQKNIERYDMGADIDLRLGSWFEPIRTDEKFHLIVSNPPYIEEGDPRCSPDLQFEPAEALYAQTRGLSDIHHLLENAPNYLIHDGAFLCEIGVDQSQQLMDIQRTEARFPPFHFEKDLAGIDRVLKLRLSSRD